MAHVGCGTGLTAAQIKTIETSVSGCQRTVKLNADGTFTSSLLRDVPGEKFTEESNGTWSSTESEVVLTATHIGGEKQTPPEIEKLTRKDGGLEIDYYDHIVPMTRN